jgi:hypothetical protein
MKKSWGENRKAALVALASQQKTADAAWIDLQFMAARQNADSTIALSDL